MSSDINTDTGNSSTLDCTLLSDSRGMILWASPETTAVLGRDSDEIIRNETVHTLFGQHAHDSQQGPAAARTLTLPVGDDTVTIYYCRRRADERPRATDVLARVTDAVIALDAEWRYTYVNDSAAELLGHSPEELLGEVVWDVFPAAKETRLKATLEAAMESQDPTTFEWYGESIERWMEIRCFPSPTGVSIYFQDITERKSRQLALQQERDLTDRLLQVSPVGLCVLRPDSTFERVNERAEEILGASRTELLENPLNEPMWEAYDADDELIPSPEFPFNVALRTGEPTFGTEMSLRRLDGTRVWVSVSAAPFHDEDGNIDRVIVAFEDITERAARERQLAAQHEELTRLNHINELIREVNRAVVGATDRDTIEKAVCDHLAQSDRYPAAMTTRLDPDETMEIEHAAGFPTELMAQLRAGDGTHIESDICQTSRTNRPTITREVQTDERYSDVLRSVAKQNDIRTIANIPIDYDGIVYGVLTVGATEAEAFGDRERSVFSELGQILGKAINSIQTKKLLYASAFHELTLAVSAPNAPLVELQGRLGETLTLDGVVPVESGRYLLYVSAERAGHTDIQDAADGIAGIESIQAIDADDRLVVQLRVGSETPLGVLIDAGGQIREGIVENGVGKFGVDVTLDTDVRRYLERVEQNGLDVELLAKREVERTAPTLWETATPDDGLTARQRTVLVTAYLSGYFDWPRRGTTGEEIADSLDISSSTVHQHLRVASKKVFRQYFGNGIDEPASPLD